MPAVAEPSSQRPSNVWLLSYAFPPGSGSGGVRAEGLARLLSEREWNVTVLTAGGEPRDAPGPVVVVVRSPVDDVVSDWSRVSGRASPAHRRRASIRAIVARLLWPDRQVLWLPGAVLRGLREAATHGRPDVIYSTSPPASLHVGARLLAFLLRRPWIAEYRDLWSLNPYSDRGKFARWAERRIIRSASAVVCVTDEASATQRDAFRCAVTTIPSGVDERLVQTSGQKGAASPRTLLHTGVFYRGTRAPVGVLRAINRLAEEGLTPDDLRFVAYGPDSSVASELASALGVAHFVEARGAISRTASIEAQRVASALVATTRFDPSEVVVAPAKLYEYVAARRPILVTGCAGSEVNRIQELCDIPFGVFGDDAVEEIAQWIKSHVLSSDTSAGGGAVPYALTQSRMADDVARVLQRVTAARAGAKAANTLDS